MTNSNQTFYFVGNLLCLDFVNTEVIVRGTKVDLLGGFADFIEWLRAARQLSDGNARLAMERWGRTSEGKLAFSDALSLRAALRRMAERLTAGKPLDRATLDGINSVLASRPAYRQVERQGKKYTSRLMTLSESPRHLLVPIAESAAWLLEQGDMSLLRRCENPNCILYFYDTTKNKRRRWCSMDACGSRAKAAAYYRRSHSSA